MIISGRSIKFDILNFKINTMYQGYNASDLTIIHFWKVVSEMTDEERVDLLKYVTSCTRPPVLGFGDLKPKFKIAKFTL